MHPERAGDPIFGLKGLIQSMRDRRQRNMARANPYRNILLELAAMAINDAARSEQENDSWRAEYHRSSARNYLAEANRVAGFPPQ